MVRSASAFSLVLLAAAPSSAGRRLLYLEAQAVSGYSSSRDRAVFYSRGQREPMQKPSAGFDLVQKLWSERGDLGALAVQGRLALNTHGTRAVEPQLYNAYLKLKTRPADVWAGHNRPALGLSSVLDSHGLLLQPLNMEGFGFDRDWGAGARRQSDWGDAACSLTSGSGMPLRLKGNWLASARISKGELMRENHSVGLSVAHGRTLDTMGYHLMREDAMPFTLGGADASFLWDAYEGRFEVLGGQRMGEKAYAMLWRAGVDLGEERRWKAEAQPSLQRLGHETLHSVSSGLSFLLSPDVTLRGLYEYRNVGHEHRVIGQMYYYLKV